MSNPLPYPESLQEAIIYFADKDRALEVMVKLRWADGVTCQHCGSGEVAFMASRRVWNCRGCRKQFSVKTGSVMEDSPLGLDKWLSAMWLIANAKNGVSSCEVARALKITQKSAWFLLHRIRLAMQTGTFEKLSGEVEADETYIGGLARNMHAKDRKAKIKGTGGAGSGKAIVMGLLERGGKARVRVIGDNRKGSIQATVREGVEPGSELHTDSFLSYRGLADDYRHKVIDHAETYVSGSVHTNGMENFWSLLKRCIKGTYVSVEPFHLFRYLDEQSFRFNERKDNDQGRFVKAGAGLAGKRLTYKELTGKAADAQPEPG